MPIVLKEREATGYKIVERSYTDEDILEIFPDSSETLVNKLLRRAQEAERKLEENDVYSK